MKNFAVILLVVLVAVVMGFLDVARAIDVDWVLAKKLNNNLGFFIIKGVTQEEVLKVGDFTTPRPPKFEIARTHWWEVAEKLTLEGWELIGVAGSHDSQGQQYIFRRPLTK